MQEFNFRNPLISITVLTSCLTVISYDIDQKRSIFRIKFIRLLQRRTGLDYSSIISGSTAICSVGILCVVQTFGNLDSLSW